MRRTLVFAAAVFLMAGLLSGCSLGQVSDKISDSLSWLEEQSFSMEEIMPAYQEEVTPSPTYAAEASQPSENDELPSAEDKQREYVSEESLYNQILTALETYETEIIFYNCEPEDIVAAYCEVIANHPEIFWAGSGYWWTSVTQGDDMTVTFTPYLSGDTATEIEEKKVLLDGVVSQVLSQLSEMTSDYEKALYIHDYLVNVVDYDQQAAAMVSAGNYLDALPECATAYGALVNGRAVCSGYANAYQLLAQSAGLSCIRVTGIGMDGESHEWNAVVMDGEWYYVDVTWDDPVYADLSTNVLSHEFFGITTEELLLTHTIDEDQDPPECTAKAFDYFVYNVLYFESSDISALSSMDLGAAFQIKFATVEMQEQAYEELFSGQGVFGLAPSWASSVKYSQGASGLVLNIEFM